MDHNCKIRDKWHCIAIPVPDSTALYGTVSVLGRDKIYTVKYNPLPEGVPEGKARGNSPR